MLSELEALLGVLGSSPGPIGAHRDTLESIAAILTTVRGRLFSRTLHHLTPAYLPVILHFLLQQTEEGNQIDTLIEVAHVAQQGGFPAEAKALL